MKTTSRVTGQQHHDALYDEIERLARQLVQVYDINRGTAKFESPDGEYQRHIDPAYLEQLAGAINQTAQELKFLRKFRGSLRVVED